MKPTPKAGGLLTAKVRPCHSLLPQALLPLPAQEARPRLVTPAGARGAAETKRVSCGAEGGSRARAAGLLSEVAAAATLTAEAIPVPAGEVLYILKSTIPTG